MENIDLLQDQKEETLLLSDSNLNFEDLHARLRRVDSIVIDPMKMEKNWQGKSFCNRQGRYGKW